MNNGHRLVPGDRAADGPRAGLASERTRLHPRVWDTIGSHLVALVAVQLVLVLGLIGFAGFQDFRKARADAARSVSGTARLAADAVAENIEESRSQLDQVPQWADLLTSPTACRFTDPDQQAAWDEDGFTSRFYLLGYDGKAMCPSPDGVRPASLANASWFKEAITTAAPVETPPIPDPTTGKPALMFAIAVPQQRTVVAFAVELASIGPTLTKQFETTSPMPAFLLTAADRSVEISSSNGSNGRELDGTSFDRPLSTSNRTFSDLDGTDRIFAEAEVPGLGWHLYTGVSTGDALRPVRGAFRDRLVLAMVIVLMMLAVAFVMQRRLVRPIRSLAHATRKIAEGKLDAKVTPSGPAELRALAASFNTMNDVRAKAESALRKSYRAEQRSVVELREVDEMRQAFLMAISHELRTPLTSVVGFASFLKEARDELSEEELNMSIETIATQSKRLERLLLDLLDVERLARGCVEPNLKDTDVRDVVMHAIERSSESSRISAPISNPVPAFVDPALVERIIENLVNNAIKHTPLGTKIWVRASRRNGDLKLTVEDNGPGVSDVMKLAIFEPFTQGDVPSHSPGTGIGLSLVSKFAKLHGGRAWVDDRRGGGAAFHVVLPAKPHEPKRRASTRRSEKATRAA